MFYMYLWIAAQIIIEMLPISSSGHLALLELLLKKYASFDIKKFFASEKILQSIYYFLHGPTLLIVAIYFFSRWWNLFFRSNGIAWHLIVYLLIADFITGLMYLFSKKYKISIPLGLGFVITMIVLFSTSFCIGSKSVLLLSFFDAIILGFVQGLASLPGISRLAFTCSIGCWLGFSLYDAFFLSWTMQVPLMAAAFSKSCKDLYQIRGFTQVLNVPIGLVILFSSGVSVIVMKLLLQMTQNNTFYLFGWYMFLPLIVWMVIKFEGVKTNVRDFQKSSH
jgi:undecaprenyl-diphosphatase